MISLGKWQILSPLQKLPKNGEDLGKLIAAKGFKKLSKVQNIAQSGHTGVSLPSLFGKGLSKQRKYVSKEIPLKIWAIPGLFLLFWSFQYNTIDSTYKFCSWQDLNRGFLALEATALPTAPQPLPSKCFLFQSVFLILF